MKKKKLYCLVLGLVTIGCYKDENYLPTNVKTNEVIIGLTATPSSIQADGVSFTYLIAELPVDAVDRKSTVTFTTTKGLFDNNTKTISLAAIVVNDNYTNRRLAKVRLTSSSEIEDADVTATVGNVSRTISVSFTTLPFDSFLSISTSAVTIPADGSSFSYITVEQPLNITNDYTSITFIASSGTFDNGTKTITKSSGTILIGNEYKRQTKVRLTSGKIEETISIEVSIKGTSKNIILNTVKAYPENIKIAVSAPAITTGFANSIQITTSLLRTTGIPSVNNEATLSVIDTNGVSRGSFINYTTNSDAAGVIVNRYTLGSDTYNGRLTVIAKGTNETGHTLVEQAQLIAQ